MRRRVVSLPEFCSIVNLTTEFKKHKIFRKDWTHLTISLPEKLIIGPSALAFLACWGRAQINSGRGIEFGGAAKKQLFLERMGILQHLHGESTGRGNDRTIQPYLPIHPIANDQDVKSAVDAVCDLVTYHFPNAAEFLPAMEWAVAEIVDNVMIHSRSEVPGVLCAWFYPSNSELHIDVYDSGIGIKASLQGAVPTTSHAAAITKALERGVTRDLNIGQGNGMAGALEIMKKNKGGFRVWTGNAIYRMEKGQYPRVLPIPRLSGTGVSFSLDTRIPVRLEETWIGAAGFSYLDQLAERLENSAIDVAAACVNVHSRLPAKRLRLRIEAILPTATEPIALNFAGVSSPTSSFLDELLGRLAEKYGSKVFSSRVKVINVNARVLSMANVVIAQRLGNEKSWTVE